MSINQSPDPDAFRDFEHAGWTSNVSEYDAAFARVTSQAIGPLLAAVDLCNGARMLDVASGPGYVAAAAAARGARVVGVDFSAPMADVKMRMFRDQCSVRVRAAWPGAQHGRPPAGHASAAVAG